MLKTGQEFLVEAIEHDFQLETICSVGPKEYINEKRRLEKLRRGTFREAVKLLSNEMNNGDKNAGIALATALRFFDDLAESCPVLEGIVEPKFRGDGKSNSFDESVENASILHLVQKAEKLYLAATSGDRIPYEFRNNWLEKAVKIVLGLNDFSDQQDWKFGKVRPEREIYHFLANAYLRRGLSILPKGKGLSAPEKKLEAMRKALHWSERALEKDGLDLDAHLARVRALYELCRMDRGSYRTLLKTAVEAVKTVPSFFPPTTPFECFCLSLYCHFNDDEGSEKEIFGFQANPWDDENNHPYLPLIRAQAGAKLLKKGIIKETDFLPKLTAAGNRLGKLGLFSPVWEDTVNFIKEAAEKGVIGWKEAAWTAWKACQKKERQMGFGLQIRQYWSRLSDIYALAYKGAISEGQIAKAVQVVDSLKGRTTLTWEEMDAFLATQKGNQASDIAMWRTRYFRSEAQSGMGGYVSGYGELMKQLPKKYRPSKMPLPETDIPSGWAAVHLYLDETDKSGLTISALTGDNADQTNKTPSWSFSEPVPANVLWEAYEKWLGVYMSSDMIVGCQETMDDLCQIIGRTLPFLFELATRVEGIIFIPHGFTHLLPLHAAKGSDGSYLFEKVSSTYLPAWALGPDTRKWNQNISKRKYCLRYHTKQNEVAVYEPLMNPASGSTLWDWERDSEQIHGNVIFDLKAEIEKKGPPEWLSILCHGKADALSPFRSALRLGPEGVSFLDLQLTPLNLRGTKVLLGACETELTPLRNSQLDEHLSLAGVFLGKGAEMVMGSLWECNGNLVRELIESALEGQERLWKVLRKKQESWMQGQDEGLPKYWDEFRGYERNKRLLYVAPFRILGYPSI